MVLIANNRRPWFVGMAVSNLSAAEACRAQIGG